MFDVYPLHEVERRVATSQEVGALEFIVDEVGRVGPLEQALFDRVIKRVSSAIEKFGVPASLYKGKVTIRTALSPIKGSIGTHDPETEDLLVYDRNEKAPLPFAKLVWTLTHELGHRIRRRLPAEIRNRFDSALETVKQPIPLETLAHWRKAAAKKVKLHGDEKRLFDDLWWFFKLRSDDDRPEAFYSWAIKHQVTKDLPTDYANVSSDEAWAETFADLVLARKKTKNSRRTSRFLRDVVRGIMNFQEASQEFRASQLNS